MRDFKRLKVWHHSHQLALSVYQATAAFPASERFGLAAQMRRAAASIPSNIAEGCGKGGNLEFGRYLRIARGSASELEYQMLLARDLGYIKEREFDSLGESLDHIQGMLGAFIKKLRETTT
jgi:four helix bundle protein